MAFRTNFTVVLAEDSRVRSVCTTITNIARCAFSTSWDVHVAELSFRARKTLVCNDWNFVVNHFVARTTKLLEFSVPVAGVLIAAFNHLPWSKRTVVVGLARLWQKLSLIVTEVASRTQARNCGVQVAQLSWLTFDWICCTFRTEKSNRTVEAIVL